MVYPGHPSRGCLQCIRRRVKCDEGKPECRRCIKRGEECPGYQRPKFRFVGSDSGNSRATGRRSSTQPDSRQQLSQQSDSSLSPQSTVSEPSPSMSRNWLEEAIPWYFQYYTVSQLDRQDTSWFDFLPSMYAACRDESHLRLSVQAAALAGFASYLHAAQLASEAQQVYGAALVALNAALKDSHLVQQDETLAAALTLVVFEAITAHSSPLQNHIDGLLAILKLRGNQQFQTYQGRTLFRQVHILLQARALMPKDHTGGTSSEDEISAITLQSQNNHSSRGQSEEDRATLTFRMNQLSGKAMDHIQRTSRGDAAYSEAVVIIEEATALDADHARSISQVPTSNLGQGYFDSQNRVIESSTMLSAMHNLYRAARVVLHEIRLRCATELNSHVARAHVPREQTYDIWVWESASTVRVVAEDIRNSLGHIFGGADRNSLGDPAPLRPGILAEAYLLLWPLLVMRLATCTTKEQREVAAGTLERIGTQFGIKQAHELLRLHKSLFEN